MDNEDPRASKFRFFPALHSFGYDLKTKLPTYQEIRDWIKERYQCHYNVRHPGECDGQSGYGVTKLDGIVSKIVRMQFERIRNEPPQDLIERQNAKEIDLAREEAAVISE